VDFILSIGVIAISICNTLSSFIFVPKLLKKMGQDDILPLFKYLIKGYGESNEPYRAHVFTVIASSIIFCRLVIYAGKM